MEIVFGVTQGLLLRPLFNTFLTDLFFIINNIDKESYADHNMPDIVAHNFDDFKKSLEKTSTTLLQCFDDNFLEKTVTSVIY